MVRDQKADSLPVRMAEVGAPQTCSRPGPDVSRTMELAQGGAHALEARWPGRSAMGLIELLILLLILGWLFGFAFAGVGQLIHILLLLAIIMLIFRLFSTGFYGRRGGPGPGL